MDINCTFGTASAICGEKKNDSPRTAKLERSNGREPLAIHAKLVPREVTRRLTRRATFRGSCTFLMRPKGHADAPAHRNNGLPFFLPLPFSSSAGSDEEINNVSPGTFSGESIQRARAREGFRFYSEVAGSYPSRNITAIGFPCTSATVEPPRGDSGDFFRSSRREPRQNVISDFWFHRVFASLTNSSAYVYRYTGSLAPRHHALE